ncbi:DUF4302 domain-containing protein [Alistipes timonensis]|uniref:DUF4302 domain-containing protein n=1 Tax=Alistipes timonensis TaxID=1465754 RepID=UPI0020CDC140|nr:DUF4302 domain-containing protein [Alistipes timonensis]MCR2030279.1 DUF4302 domain-containing protein [Alistipes timonensis]
MKKSTIITLLLLAVPTLLTSCLFDEEDLFDKSASERIEAAKQEAKTILESAENGWHVRYFPSPTQEFGGYNLFFKFSDGKVTVASEIERDPSTTETSLYSLGEDLGVTLNFDTKNALINYFVHPRNPDGLGSSYKGMEGDYKFTVMETSAEQVILRGIISGNYYVMTPVAAETDWASELETYRNNSEDMAFSTYSFVVNGKAYPATLTNRRFAVKIDNETTFYVPFIYTKTGLSFYMPIEADGVTAQDFDFVDGYYFAEANGADFKIMTPEPIRSDITFQASVPDAKRTYNQVGIDVIPSTDEEYYYVEVMLKSEFESLREKKLLQKLIGALNQNIGAGDDVEAIAAARLMKGTQTYTMKYPSFYDEYVAVVFGCAVSNGFIVSTTAITSVPFSVDSSLLPSNTDALYKRWLGKWRVTSTSSQENGKPVTFDVLVKPGTVNSSYMIRGWGITIYGDMYDLRAYYQASFSGATNTAIPIPKSTGILYTKADNEEYGKADGIYPIRTRYSRIFFDTGVYYSFTTTQTSPKLVGVYDTAQNGQATMYGVRFNTGTDYVGIEFFRWTEDSKSYYTSPAVRPGYTAKDFPVGPFTWVQLVDADGNEISGAEPRTTAATTAAMPGPAAKAGDSETAAAWE